MYSLHSDLLRIMNIFLIQHSYSTRALLETFWIMKQNIPNLPTPVFPKQHSHYSMKGQSCRNNTRI